ncbi:MAG: chorismate lyase [Pseudomonadota bacterium]
MTYRAQRPIEREPAWRPERQCPRFFLPASVRRWLLDDGSLTNHLIDISDGQFRVQRLHQGWQVPLISEQRLLGMSLRGRALVREVMLLIRDRPVVFARSVFPSSTLAGELRHLRRLQNRSLGSILFQSAGMSRSPFEIARLAGDSPYLPQDLRQRPPAWGRRSRFVLSGAPLMVSEVFLEAFAPWPATLPVHRTQRGRVDPENLAAKQ